MLSTICEFIVRHLSVLLGVGLLSAVAAIITAYINYKQQDRFHKEDAKHAKQFNTVFGNEKPGLINAEANLLRIEQLNLQSEEIEYGECGAGVFWKYEKQSKVLEIHGYGPMVPGMGYHKEFDNDDIDSYFKFSKLAHDVKKVIINEGITYIESSTFCGYDALEEAYIGPNIKRIPFDCFRDCINLKHVYLPYDLEEIGAFSFRNCISLMDVSLPRKLKVIENGAFFGCSSFCNLVKTGFLMDSIGVLAFAHSGLQKISIWGVRRICDSAFADTTALKTVEINNYGRITGSPFANSDVRSIILGYGGYISEDAFDGCEKLKKIIFGEDGVEYGKTIPEIIFKYPRGLIELNKKNKDLLEIPKHYKGCMIIKPFIEATTNLIIRIIEQRISNKR